MEDVKFQVSSSRCDGAARRASDPFAFRDGIDRLAAAIEAAVATEHGRVDRLSAGLQAALEFLADDPPLARLLLVDSLGAQQLRDERERSFERLARALRGYVRVGGNADDLATGRLFAGGLTSLITGRVLGGEVELLAGSHGLLLAYLLAPTPPAQPLPVGERPA